MIEIEMGAVFENVQSPMSYDESLAWLYGTQERGIKMGLDRMRAFLAGLGWEQGRQRFLHVAGTNGKGSVCAMLESICRAAGMSTGLFTSPHLVTFRERIRRNGEMAGKAEIAEHLTRIRGVCERMGIQPTFFEITTGLAFEIFREAPLDVIVLETGLGGRLDSTNVVLPLATAITSVGLDHMQFLGETLAEIAWEKAGIIKAGVPVVIGPMPEEAEGVIAKVAAERGAALIRVGEGDFLNAETQRRRGGGIGDFEVGLKGMHQSANAAVALRTLEAAGLHIAPEHLVEGLRRVRWPGRFQDTGRGYILDGAHNPDAARGLVATWRAEYGERRTPVILGVVRDKDARGICAELARVAEEFVIVPVRSPRAGSAEQLREIAAAWRPSRACGSLGEGIATARAGGDLPVLITGSLFLMGEALVLLGLEEGEQEISAQ
jgi:dihydrofolate synthase/folylpolyglutamate synthase